jgi:dipeptidase
MMKRIFIPILVIVLNSLGANGQENFDLNCYSILVGKDASTDGSVFFAHNEDDMGQNFVDLHKVPHINHAPGEKQIFMDGMDSINEVSETFGYLWITGTLYNEEQYLNEWGVAITSNSSRSNVINGNGRIEHNLRRLVAERARSAREAVKIAGAIVDRYGYAGSGRVYSIADPNEAWVFEVANGKHWIARRVPDDELVIIPNYYVINSFNMPDTLNYLSSPDIIDYAVTQGWYNPQTDASFNFRKAYCRKDRFEAVFNIARKWVILNKLSEKQYALNDDFPFSFKPKQKVNIQVLMEALQNHYENTVFERDACIDNGSPHKGMDTLRVCNMYNDYSCITQLRSWLPADIGNIMWIAPRYPCIQPFIPWYYGINKISSQYEKAPYITALQDYNFKNKDYKKMYPDHACWVFDDFSTRLDSNYGKEIKLVQDWKTKFEMEVLKTVELKENEILNIYKSDPDTARQMLTDVTNNFADKALMETKKLLLLK